VAAQRDKYAASNAQTNATGTYTLNQDTASKNFQAGISMMSDMDQQIQKQMFDLQQLANEGKIVQGSEDWNARAQAIRDNAEATERLKESMGPLTQYVKEASDTWKTMQDLAVTAFNDIGSAIADVASGATTAHDALVKVIQDLAKMAAQAAFKSIAGSLLGSALGGGGGGGLFSSLFGGGGVVDSGTWTLADGGVMSPWGKLPLNAYSGGGVANSPQMAVFGEGRMNEAYVPLPDGKSIPVSLKGGSGGSSIQNNFEINVAVGGGPGGAAPGSSGGQGPNPQQIGEAVAAAMRNSVVQIIQDQLRTGGALNPSMG
jgi:phage-related minor tail protein